MAEENVMGVGTSSHLQNQGGKELPQGMIGTRWSKVRTPESEWGGVTPGLDWHEVENVMGAGTLSHLQNRGGEELLQGVIGMR